MANNDSVIGGILVAVGGISLIAEIIFLIVKPITDGTPFDDSSIYWAMAIPLFLGVAGVLAILIWIGVTMIQTPPPEAWDFDDLEDELGEETDNQGKSADASSDLSSVAGLSKVNMETLIAAGIDTKAKLASSTVEKLTSLKGIGKVSAEKMIASSK